MESHGGIGDTATRSYRGLQQAVATLTDDPYVVALALDDAEGSENNRDKVARANLLASQLVAYLEGQTGLVGLGGDAGGVKQYAPWINIAGINASASVVQKAMSVAGATGDGDKNEDE